MGSATRLPSSDPDPRPGADARRGDGRRLRLAGSWGRQAVTGTITLDGQPLGDGAIRLERPALYAAGKAVGATVRHGSFAISRDQGPTPGTYRVRIYSSSGVEAPSAAGQTDGYQRPMAERLPAIYNTNSELRVDVTAEGPNRFRFELHAAPDR